MIRLAEVRAGFSLLPVEVAERQGFFEDAGLRVEANVAESGPAAAQVLQAGGADAMFNGSNIVLGLIAQTGKGQVLGAMYDRMVWKVIAATGADVAPVEATPSEKVRSMANVRIATTAPGSAVEGIFLSLLREEGLDDQAQLVPLGGVTGLAAGLRTGQADVSYCQDPDCGQMEAEGVGETWLELSEFEQFSPWTTDLWMVTDQFAENNPEAVNRFREAMGKAMEWISTNVDSAELQALAEEIFTEYDPDVLAEGLAYVGPAFSFELTEAQYENVLRFASESGIDDSGLAYQDVVYK